LQEINRIPAVAGGLLRVALLPKQISSMPGFIKPELALKDIEHDI